MMIANASPKPFRRVRLNRSATYQRKERFAELCETHSVVLVLLSHDASTNPTWTAEKDRRRCSLIDKSLQGDLTDTEQRELSQLQMEAEDHFDEVAPPPIEGALRLHAQLLKLSGASNE